jgi:hypothetical protein
MTVTRHGIGIHQLAQDQDVILVIGEGGERR